MRGFIIIFLVLTGVYIYLSLQLIKKSNPAEILKQTTDKAKQDLQKNSILSDLEKSYKLVLSIFGVTTIICFIWILLLKYNAKLIVWGSILTLPIINLYCLFYAISTYAYLLTTSNQSDEPVVNNSQELNFELALQNILTAEFLSYARNDTLWLIICIVLAVAFILLVVVLHFLRKRVGLSIALIGQASKAINCVKSSLLFPLIPRAVGLTVFVYGIVVALLIISAGQSNYVVATPGPDYGTPCIPNRINITQTLCKRIIPKKDVWKWHGFNIFCIIWILNFISAISQTTLAGAFSAYYWTLNKPHDVPFFAITQSFGRVITKHLSDIAFGSFLMSTVQYLRIVIEFITNRFRSKQQTVSVDVANSIKYGNCFVRFFFWFLDRFLKYIDRNAYIIMSMYHKGYLDSAKSAVKLLYQNSVRALVLDYVTFFVLLISRLLITGFAGYLCYHQSSELELNYKYLPMMLVIIGTYFISKGLFSVYSMAVDTLFVCFLIESNYSDGSAERPYYMSKELRKIMKRSMN